MHRLATVILALALAACQSAPKKDALYDALGGEAGIQSIVENALYRIEKDPRINEYFVNTDMPTLRDRLVEQFCVEAGGPCQYLGGPMDFVHEGLDIGEADFNALVENLIDAMEELKVPTTAQNGLLARLAPMRKDILHR